MRVKDSFWTFVSAEIFEKLLLDCVKAGIKLESQISQSKHYAMYAEAKSGAAFLKMQIEGDHIRHYRRSDFYKITSGVI